MELPDYSECGEKLYCTKLISEEITHVCRTEIIICKHLQIV